MLVPKELYRHTLGGARVCNHVLPPFVVSSGVREDCLISSFLFDFVVKDVLNNGLFGLLKGGVGFHLGNKFFDLEYINNTVLLSVNVQALQHGLDDLVIKVS